MRYRTVGVVGAGVIGSGVAQRLAQYDHRVVLVDIDVNVLERALSRIAKALKFAALFDDTIRGASHAKILACIELTTDYDRLGDADVVIENSPESWPVKKSIYPRLDLICRGDCFFAANTSAISITRLAATTRRPDRVIGMHFMNPVAQKNVVEVVRGWHTSEDTVQAAGTFLRELGMRAIIVNDMPGFVSNRVLMLMINEAILVVQDKVASPSEVDTIFTGCFAHKMGPLATADLIGLDTVLLTLDVLYESFGADKFHACPLLRKMVDAGLRGRKSGKGFFEYASAVEV